MSARSTFGLALLLVAALPETARPQGMRLPLGGDCGGGNCVVTAYWDHDGRDWNCGAIRYGMHSGTDYATSHAYGSCRTTKDVVAAAPGRVVAVHDGEEDNCGGYLGAARGNCVTVQHADGRRTRYYHLARGSIVVRTGQSVSCGTPLGKVGMSGRTTGPHLHFEAYPPGSGMTSDPYSGPCSSTRTSWWAAQGRHGGLPGTACAGGPPPGPVFGDGRCAAEESCEGCAADCGRCPPRCGDGRCEAPEACAACPGDCGACAGPVCGDGRCEWGETCAACPGDCGPCAPRCSDGTCDGGETCAECPGDCGPCAARCGDGTCDGGETCVTCAGDCGPCPPRCGDGTCDASEDCTDCSADCGRCPARCGDRACDAGEDCARCPEDCGACPPRCGDGACDGGETCTACPDDCGPCPPRCGDRFCDPDETCETCPRDCGACPVFCGDGRCDRASESCTGCPEDCGACPPRCGDGECSGGETCASCALDCGSCTGPVEAMEIGWERYGDGTFEIRALPPPDAVRVEFLVDGYRVGEAGPASGTAFAITYRFHGEGTGRQVEARATNAGGRVIARGYGSLDVVGGATAVFIRQIAARTYEIGLERPPAEVAAIEVRADGHLLTDELSGESRATRLAVQSGFYTLGSRAFEVSTFNFDGSWRGTLRRSFTLR